MKTLIPPLEIKHQIKQALEALRNSAPVQQETEDKRDNTLSLEDYCENSWKLHSEAIKGLVMILNTQESTEY